MNSINIYIINILKEALTQEIFDIKPVKDIETIHHELEVQSVLPLAYNWLKRTECQDNNKMYTEWAKEIFQHVAFWYRMLDEQNQLVELLTNNGYSFVIMKGFANAELYPKPELRTTGDIDFLVDWDAYEEVYKLLVHKGYIPIKEKDDSKHHVELCKNNIIYELHRQPGGTRRKQWWQVDFFREGLKNSRMISLEGYRFPVFSELHYGIMLLVHTRAHFTSGIGLRHLLDWLVFAEKYITDDFWETKMRSVAAKFEIDELAAVLSRCGQLYFDMLKERKWCEYVSEDVCDEVMDYFFTQGDFGKKAGTIDSSVKAIAEMSEIDGFFRRINRSSEYSMPIVRKYPVLRPIGWIYQIGRYITKAVSEKNSIDSFQNELSKGKKRKELFEKIKVQKW